MNATTGYLIFFTLRITLQANSSSKMPIIMGNMDMLPEALGTCNYLLSQLWVDHFPHSKTRPYVDLCLYATALKTCKGMLEMMFELIIQRYAYASDQ